MDPILLFFVFPLVTIIFAIALQLLLNNPILVSAIIFAVFLVVTFVAFTSDFLIFAIIYAIIAGVIISTTQNLDTLKVIGILSIIIGFFANEILLVGGIFTLIAVSKERNTTFYRNDTYYNNDNDYRIYR